ncbi:hypothetical protein KKF34_14325 [Myxococcota bacterium]|nr:hypothetical protein [Myxococcota bacterium]MBU1380722.1 hypothetical protein [Myxococcota bacterium]MBU1498050.1 hypothetical protein [Myxococcota bacterium]
MEFIYVVKRSEISDILPEKGVCDITSNWKSVLARGFFIERSYAEKDSSFKQVIPYVIIRRGTELFRFLRLKGGGEKRLHNKSSIGIGGHINPDGTLLGWDLIMASAMREINEELKIDMTNIEIRPLFLLNDDTNEVGSVHLGLVCECNLPGNHEVEVREKDVLTGEFVNPAVIRTEDAALESWSEIVLDLIHPAGGLK